MILTQDQGLLPHRALSQTNLLLSHQLLKMVNNSSSSIIQLLKRKIKVKIKRKTSKARKLQDSWHPLSIHYMIKAKSIIITEWECILILIWWCLNTIWTSMHSNLKARTHTSNLISCLHFIKAKFQVRYPQYINLLIIIMISSNQYLILEAFTIYNN